MPRTVVPAPVKGRSPKQLAKAVARGAKFLDKNKPDWYKVVDPDTLQLSSPYRCVIGQIADSVAPRACFGDLVSDTTESFIPLCDGPLRMVEWLQMTTVEAARKGFTVSPADIGEARVMEMNHVWRLLDKLWEAEIEIREIAS